MDAIIAQSVEINQLMNTILTKPEDVYPAFTLPPGHPLHASVAGTKIPTVNAKPSLLLHGLNQVYASATDSLRKPLQDLLEELHRFRSFSLMVGASGIGRLQDSDTDY